MYSSNSTFQMVESALSPPYDGSEFQELFPELMGMEPEEMVDIESLADHQALDSVDITGDPSLAVSDKDSNYSFDTNSDNATVSDLSEPEEQEDDPEDLLRYLIGETRQSKRGRNKNEKQSIDHTSDSCRFSNNSQTTSENLQAQTMLVSRKYIKQGAQHQHGFRKPALKATVTVVDDKGVRKTVQGPNRNAVMAKLNRERKKQLMVDMEEKVGLLGTENDALKKQNVRLRKKVSNLTRELQYVKGVLANQSALSSLLKNIRATELEFHTSMPTSSTCSKRKRPSDHDYCLELEQPANKMSKFDYAEPEVSPAKEFIQPVSNTAGVCLHVSGKSVSLEFCPNCSEKANAASAVNRDR